MAPERSQSVAVLGLGAMGGRVARRLLDGGRRVVVWNRSAEKAAALGDAGAEAAASPAAAVTGVDVVITMLADPAALDAVCAGFAPVLRPGQTVVEMSTVGPEAVERLRAAVPPGVGVVDAPVIGSVEAAAGGTLTLFVGGEAADVAGVRELLGELGAVVVVGGPALGAAAKLVANSTLFGVLTSLGEAIALGDALGLERDATFAVLEHTPLAAQAERRRAAIAEGDYPPRFALRLARKDAMLVAEAARAAGVDVPAAEAARGWLAAAERGSAGELDYTAVLSTIIGGAAPDAAIAAAASSTWPRQARASLVADTIRRHGGYRWVGLYDVGDREVTIVAWSGGGPPAYPRFPRDRGLTGRAVEAAATVVAGDVGADTDYLEAFADTRSEAIVPVVVDGSVVGTIDVETSEPHAFGDDDTALLERCRDAAVPLWGTPLSGA
jgi:3-hydroxyisobutyrate dehydrogenase/2-hydroxy-3-oxopropionate reductase